ncbi:MAG TPA: GNAT family N-acetyltransferase [Candidatus Dormibacteraeota bacterium]
MPDEIEIRPVRPSEYAAAGDATARAYREFRQPNSPGWDAYLARVTDVGSRAGLGTVLVAIDSGVIAGSATLELDARISPGPAEPLAPDEAHLRMVGVSPEHRGKGIGRRLVIACIDLARERGRSVMTLDTDVVMVAAQQLYLSLGFVSTGLHQNPGRPELLGYRLDIAAEPRTTR